jgi:cupin 2 domain-containing protein
VVLLTGSATLQFSDRMIDMKPGDHILIAAHERHRVERTDLATQTIWLAVFFR